MDELIEQTNILLEHLDKGDLMSCYSIFESAIRPLLDDLDQEDEFIKLWQKQRSYVDDEDWAAVLEGSETLREYLNA